MSRMVERGCSFVLAHSATSAGTSCVPEGGGDTAVIPAPEARGAELGGCSSTVLDVGAGAGGEPRGAGDGCGKWHLGLSVTLVGTSCVPEGGGDTAVMPARETELRGCSSTAFVVGAGAMAQTAEQ